MDGAVFASLFNEVSKTAFLLKFPPGLRLRYDKGLGLSGEISSGFAPAEANLFVQTSMFSAAAWFNGYLPLRASALILGNAAFVVLVETPLTGSNLCQALAEKLKCCANGEVVALAFDERGCLQSSITALPVLLRHPPESVEELQGVREGSELRYATSPRASELQLYPVKGILFVEMSGDKPSFRSNVATSAVAQKLHDGLSLSSIGSAVSARDDIEGAVSKISSMQISAVYSCSSVQDLTKKETVAEIAARITAWPQQ